MQPFTVYKCDEQGNLLLSYTGELIERGETWVCIQAKFALDNVPIGPLTLQTGDLMTEWFYADRYYNVFCIEKDGYLKGWYCNITRPAQITETSVSADDLALDVIVSPDREITLLDEAEFDALDITKHERQSALNAVQTLRDLVAREVPPFIL